MSAMHTVGELVQVLADTYGAIDIRTASIREGDRWVGAMTVVRLTYEGVDEAKSRIQVVERRFPPVKTDSLRIDSLVRPFPEWPAFCADVKEKGILRFEECDINLRQRPDLNAATGNLRTGYFTARSFDGCDWPGLDVTFDPGGSSPLMDNKFTKIAQLRGYGDVFEAVNALCELNVTLAQYNCSDFLLCVPVFAMISTIGVNLREKHLSIAVKRHHSLSHLSAALRLRTVANNIQEPFREQASLRLTLESTEGALDTASDSARFESLTLSDWFQARLVDPDIGEVQRTEGYVRALVSPAERNILLESVKLFCGNDQLDNLLLRAHSAKAPRLNQSAGFELHVSWLLSMYGFSTIVLGDYEHIVAPETGVHRASVDILASRQRDMFLLLVACTLNPPKAEDFGNLRYAREILAREVFAEAAVRIVPVLFTAATGCPSFDSTGDGFDVVPIVDGDKMEMFLDLLRGGQERTFFEFLARPDSL